VASSSPRLALVSLFALLAGCAARRPAPLPERALGVALTTPGGERITLADLAAGQEATVLVFWSATCPCVRRYQERVDALLDAWPGHRVRVIGVSSNAGEPFAEVLRVARERGVRVPLHRDEGGRLADALGARSTPAVALLAGGALRYLGWLDNERLPGDPRREPWLERAVAGVLGDATFAPTSPVYGCLITRSLNGPAPGSCCTDRHPSN
jgi:hypothetical protein